MVDTVPAPTSLYLFHLFTCLTNIHYTLYTLPNHLQHHMTLLSHTPVSHFELGTEATKRRSEIRRRGKGKWPGSQERKSIILPKKLSHL